MRSGVKVHLQGFCCRDDADPALPPPTGAEEMCTDSTRAERRKALVAQSCPILCDRVDCSPPGSSVHGALQARILEWVAFPFFSGSSRPRNQTGVSYITGGFFTSCFSSLVRIFPVLAMPLLEKTLILFSSLLWAPLLSLLSKCFSIC